MNIILNMNYCIEETIGYIIGLLVNSKKRLWSNN